MIAAFVHPSAIIEDSAVVAADTRIWHHAHVRAGARIGADCIVGKSVYIDTGVVVGDRVKIQNNASLFRGAVVEDGAFIGPHCVLTNDRLPRAIRPDGRLKTDEDWQVAGVCICYGASLGAGSVILGGVRVGRWALVGAASLVAADIPDHALAYGHPARVHGYICKCGNKRAENIEALECACLTA